MISVAASLGSARVDAQALTWSLADGNEGWPGWAREAVTRSMTDAAALYNQYGVFDKHVTANYNAGVPTAQGNYDGWIDFGGSYNTRTALHEIAHTLGVGTYRPFDGAAWDVNAAAGQLEKLYEGRAAVLSTGGSHFWPYGLNYDNEDGPGARERHCKLVSALRFDMGIVVDSDRDGLPDDWETLHFKGLQETADGDPDRDGIRNLDEYSSDGDPQQACPVRDGHSYVLRSQIADRALTLKGGLSREGVELEQRTAADLPGQHWTAHYVEAGFWRFTSEDSEQVLEVPGQDTASGRPLRLAPWTKAFQQQWRIVGGPGAKAGYFQLANRETARVVDGLDGAEGAAVQQWPFLGELPQQFWVFEEVQAPVVAAGSGGVGGAGVAGRTSAAGSGGTAGARSSPAGSGASARSDAGVAVDAGESETVAAGVTTNAGRSAGPGIQLRNTSSGCSLARAGANAGRRTWALALLAIAVTALRRIRRRRSTCSPLLYDELH